MGPFNSNDILDNILHLQDITVLCYMPLNILFCALHHCVPSTALRCWCFWLDMAVFKAQPGSTLQFRHTDKILFIPEDLQLMPARCFSGRCGHALPMPWAQPVTVQFQLEAVAHRAWVSKTGGACMLCCRPALQRWAPGEGM